MECRKPKELPLGVLREKQKQAVAASIQTEELWTGQLEIQLDKSQVPSLQITSHIPGQLEPESFSVLNILDHLRTSKHVQHAF